MTVPADPTWYPPGIPETVTYEGFTLTHDQNTLLYRISSAPDGKIPQFLSGQYTGLQKCKSHIDQFLKKLQKA